MKKEKPHISRGKKFCADQGTRDKDTTLGGGKKRKKKKAHKPVSKGATQTVSRDRGGEKRRTKDEGEKGVV